MKTQTADKTIWLDPECNEWDRREWESLWAMDELQSGTWHYLGTVKAQGQWIHQFESGDCSPRIFAISAYSLWERMR